MLTRLCRQCGIQFLVKPYRFNSALYCSRACYGFSERGRIPKSAFKKGSHHSPKTEFKIGTQHRYWGKSSPALGKHWKQPAQSVKKRADNQRGKPHLSVRGVNHHNWQGGITPLNKKERDSLEYKLWRTAVFERDNYTCIWCGATKKYLNADHIKPFAYFPELRLSLDNGRTLCIDCHEKTDTYGGRARQKKHVN